MSIRQTTKSDELPKLRQLFSENGVFAQFGQLVQINLILDANAVLADLRWLVCKARNPAARTNLLESIDSETIVAFAPTYLNIEVEKNILIIAEEEGIEPSLFVEKWQIYKAKINFIESGGPEENVIDPKDVPYVNLHKRTGYSVLSEDPHISKMGAQVVGIEITALAQSYGREAVVEYKIKAGLLSTFTVSTSMIKIASEFIKTAMNYTKRVPLWAWALVLGVFVFALSFEGVRKWLMQKIQELPKLATDSAESLFKLLEPLVLEYQQSQLAAHERKNQLLREAGV